MLQIVFSAGAGVKTVQVAQTDAAGNTGMNSRNFKRAAPVVNVDGVMLYAQNCAACHGPGLNKPVSGEYPRLAGQHATYIYWALRQYQIGGNNPNFGRNNAIMAAQVQSLSQSDLKDLAAYIASLDGNLVLKK